MFKLKFNSLIKKYIYYYINAFSRNYGIIQTKIK